MWSSRYAVLATPEDVEEGGQGELGVEIPVRLPLALAHALRYLRQSLPASRSDVDSVGGRQPLDSAQDEIFGGFALFLRLSLTR